MQTLTCTDSIFFQLWCQCIQPASQPICEHYHDILSWLQVPSLQPKVDCILSNYLVTKPPVGSIPPIELHVPQAQLVRQTFLLLVSTTNQKKDQKRTALNLVPRCQSWRFGLGTLSKCGQGTKWRKGCKFHRMQSYITFHPEILRCWREINGKNRVFVPLRILSGQTFRRSPFLLSVFQASGIVAFLAHSMSCLASAMCAGMRSSLA